MEGFELVSISNSIHQGLRVLLKNSFIHTEEVSAGLNDSSSSRRSHSAPPRFNSSESAPKPTTLMMRNIPTKFTQNTLLTVLSNSFDVASLDFFYLPMDFKSGKNLGYAFLNFTCNAAFTEFVNQFSNTRLSPQSSKVLLCPLQRFKALRKTITCSRLRQL